MVLKEAAPTILTTGPGTSTSTAASLSNQLEDQALIWLEESLMYFKGQVDWCSGSLEEVKEQLGGLEQQILQWKQQLQGHQAADLPDVSTSTANSLDIAEQQMAQLREYQAGVEQECDRCSQAANQLEALYVQEQQSRGQAMAGQQPLQSDGSSSGYDQCASGELAWDLLQQICNAGLPFKDDLAARGLRLLDVAVLLTSFHCCAGLLPNLQRDRNSRVYMRTAAERCGGHYKDFYAALTQHLKSREEKAPCVQFTELRWMRFMKVSPRLWQVGVLLGLYEQLSLTCGGDWSSLDSFSYAFKQGHCL